MSFYTTQLRDLIENGYDIGLKKYPIFDEAYRPVLNQKIIDHYYMREIGAETPALFVFYLNRKLNEIMPYYNRLYLSELKEYDPLITNIVITDHIQKNNDKTQDDHEGTHTTLDGHTGEHETIDDGVYTRDRTNDDTGTLDDTRHEDFSEHVQSHTDTHTEENTFSENRSVSSDTPQQQVGMKGIMTSALYATTGTTGQQEGATVSDVATDTTTDTTHEQDNTQHQDTTLHTREDIDDTSKNTQTHEETAHDRQEHEESSLNKHYGDHFEDFHEEVKGLNTNSQPELITAWRDTFLNIDMDIINELACCFMMLWE